MVDSTGPDDIKGDSDLDLVAVERWCAVHVPGFAGPLRARKFAGGQSNPTYLLTTPGAAYVLRRKPPGKLLKSAHAVDREYRVQSALWGSGVPVPRMLALCAEEGVIGSIFYVMAHVEGRNFADPRLPEVPRADRAAVFDEMNRVLATLHGLDYAALGLADYGRPGNYFERQLARWTEQYRAAATGPQPDMETLMTELARRLPPDDGRTALVHGDYRIDNMIFSGDGTACRAVLDWELSTIGHPFADLAYVVMQWQMPPGPERRGLAGVDRAAEGLPSDAEFVARYCERTGLPGIPDFGFYLGFSFFRIAAILQGIAKRVIDGTAANPEQGRRMGALVPEYAALGVKALDHG